MSTTIDVIPANAGIQNRPAHKLCLFPNRLVPVPRTPAGDYFTRHSVWRVHPFVAWPSWP